jgi:hypothetical protein
MPTTDDYRALLADGTRKGSFAQRARGKRSQKLIETFPGLGDMTVLDLGGTPQFWGGFPVRPAHVTLVNLLPVASPADWIKTVEGDACSPPESMRNTRFDLVVSNSVIEHVGGHAQRQRFAEVVEKSADRHWVQTPYRYFPIEPHWLFPFMQFLPLRVRATITQRWPLSPGREKDLRDAVANAASVELRSITEMRSYFPESTIWYERFGLLVKSLTAIRS